MHRTQKQSSQNTQQSEIQTVLREFARLSLRANEADSQQEGATAATLLERIMKLCSAQRGAIVLVNAPDGSTAKEATASGERILTL
ncbi:MAG TPA: hypothetical protein VKU38_23215, partial [Ktedonobacteraceae bacterium]|nr:hypothetical protein [Ktedonobacteraceae bacterium]